jgi:putative ABC transport system permease protein
MKIRFDLDRWQEILMTITQNKSRSLLTAFGVFWGIFMLLTMIGGGKGLQKWMAANFSGFATNSAVFWAQSTSEAYAGFGKGRWWQLDMKDVKRLRNIEGLALVSPMQQEWGVNLVKGTKDYTGSMRGLEPNYVQIEEQKLLYGRFINEIDLREQRKVCVIGNEVYENLFTPGTNPCGQFIQMNSIYYQVVGVSDKMTSNINFGARAGQTVSIPLTTFQNVLNRADKVGLIMVLVDKGYKLADVENEMQMRIKKAHHIAPNDMQAVKYFNTAAMFEMMDNLFTGIRLLVGIVGLGTLFAGAIGVSNIMMVTVKERTTEIGIRRAIGATPKTIMRQIISESIVLTTIAGTLGISFTVMILQLIDTAMEMGKLPAHFQVSFWTALGTAFLLLTLGVFAGLAPAYRAMAIKPVDAMRDE